MNIKTILSTAILLLSAACSSQDTLIVSELTISGRPSDEISEEQLSEIRKLTIRGEISGKDWNLLFEMATSGSLEILDMSEADIVGDNGQSLWKDDEIPEYGFSESKTLKEVFLPGNLKAIGTEAFAECRNLTMVHFPEGVDSIAARAFYKSGLSGEFDMPDSLRVISRQAFAQTNLSKVIISSDITATEEDMVYAMYGNSAFAACGRLTELVVEEGCTMLEIGFEHCSSLKSISLPVSLREIGHTSESTGHYIFKDCSALESIILPENLWFIGCSAFEGTSLKRMIIPDKVQYLRTYAFSNCASLEELILPSSLMEIAFGCFKDCTLLDNIVIPDNVTELGSSAFENCSSLKSLSFGENIFHIGSEAFRNCVSLESVFLPRELRILLNSAFEGCVSLSEVHAWNKLEKIGSTAFKDCLQLQDVTLGESLYSIGSSSFFHCPKLTRLTIPESVAEIGNYAFAYTELKELTVPWQSPVPIEDSVFNGVYLQEATLKVPIGTKSLYENAQAWKDFGIIEEL